LVSCPKVQNFILIFLTYSLLFIISALNQHCVLYANAFLSSPLYFQNFMDYVVLDHNDLTQKLPAFSGHLSSAFQLERNGICNFKCDNILLYTTLSRYFRTLQKLKLLN
jgi:hypothetical protein